MNSHDRYAFRENWMRQRNEQIEEHSGIKYCFYKVPDNEAYTLDGYTKLPELAEVGTPPCREYAETDFLGISVQLHAGGMYGRERVWWFVAEQGEERLVAVIRDRYKPHFTCRATSERFATRVLVAGKFAADSVQYDEIEI